jgi:hypothetical protein
MGRKRTGRPRGRPRKAITKRRFTTRHGRKYGVEPIDHGSAYLRARKLRLTGRFDLPMDPAGVLLGRALIDAEQYGMLPLITEWLQRVARAWGGKDGSVSGLWSALLDPRRAWRKVEGALRRFLRERRSARSSVSIL